MPEVARKKPGPVPRISQQDIVKVARELHARGQLTMTAIAEELGVTVGALYRYVPDKASILSLLAVDERDAAEAPEVGSDVAAWLGDVIRHEAEFWAEHPHMQSIGAIAPPTQPGAEKLRRAIQLLTDRGVPPTDALVAMTAASILSFGIGMGDRMRQDQIDPDVRAATREVLGSFGIEAAWPEVRDRLMDVVVEYVRARVAADE